MHRGTKLVIVVVLAGAIIALWPRDVWQSSHLRQVALEAVRERTRDDGLRLATGYPPTLHQAGRRDMRAMCGWLSSAASPKPRFFFVLFESRLLGVGIRDVFVQDTPGRASGTGVEEFCRRPPIIT